LIVLAACLGQIPAIGALRAADELDLPPIEYSTTAPVNPVSALQGRIERGETSLPYEKHFGYLRGLLKELSIPADSQMLVFSKTSLQLQRISPRTPRALYFNDDVYVGFCQNGDVLEISTADPRLGTVFYTVDQKEAPAPKFTRQVESCLICHSSSRTENVPGHLVRSLYADRKGMPIYSGGSFNVDHTTPFEHRWGGWYVTGTHGDQKHLGNLTIATKEVPARVDNAAGQNLLQLPDLVEKDGYLETGSDIVALMVLEHQTLVHNRITRANFAAREALHADAEMRKILGKPDGEFLDSTQRRIANAGDKLVNALLLVGEPKLTSPVRGTSTFTETFQTAGPRDPQGRSLRDLDLETRLFKYPCSYLIASRSFQELPEPMRSHVWKKLREVLVLGQERERYSHLSDEDRIALVEIIQATVPGVPEGWSLRAS
jgi:hypothetical protein